MAWNNLLICFLLVVFGTFRNNAQNDPDNSDMSNGQVQNTFDAANWLSGRGWIPAAGEASELYSVEDLLRKFQMYAGLPETGVFDDATRDKMNSPHCGNPDFGEEGFSLSVTRRKRFTHLGTRWPQNEITWYLENETPDLSQSIVRREMQQAFQIWADVTSLTFREVSTTSADIIIQFAIRDHGDGNSFDGRGRTLAHAFQPGFGRGGDLHFDDDETFTASTGINLFQVAVHEVGHSLGLGHSSDNNAIMAPFYNYRSNFALGTDDINGIQALYGGPIANPPTRPPITTQPTTTAAPPTTTPPGTFAPIFCNAHFNASTESFDNAIYLFQGTQILKIVNSRIQSGYPRPISQELPGAPEKVDGAFLWEVNAQNKYMYLFKGSLYWRFYNGVASVGYPRPLSNWGLPVANIDAVFRWPGNDRIYFFKDRQYYRYNTMTYSIDPGYPRPLSVWNNVQGPVSTVLDFGSNSYFFSGQYFQFFIDSQFTATNQIQTAPVWLGCRTEGLEIPGTTEIPTTIFDIEDDDDDNDGSFVIPSISVVVVTSFFALWQHLV